jgi:hypothetical protein
MDREDRELLRKLLRGEPVPWWRVTEVIHAVFGRMPDDGHFATDIILRFLAELRPDGPQRRLKRPGSIRRRELLPLARYIAGGRVPAARLREVVDAECARLQGEGVHVLAKMVLDILDGLRPADADGRGGPGRKERGR